MPAHVPWAGMPSGERNSGSQHSTPKVIHQHVTLRSAKKVAGPYQSSYAEATNFDNIADGYRGEQAKNKSGVASAARVKQTMMGDYGKAQNDISAQFLVRLAKEIPNFYYRHVLHLEVCQFGEFQYFQVKIGHKLVLFWRYFLPVLAIRWPCPGDSLSAFSCGELALKKKSFPEKIAVEALSEDLEFISTKNFYAPKNDELLNKWFNRVKADKTLSVVPLKNGVSVSTSKAYLTSWAKDAIAYLHCNSNDMQHAEQMTTLYSSVFGSAHGLYVTPGQFRKSCHDFYGEANRTPDVVE